MKLGLDKNAFLNINWKKKRDQAFTKSTTSAVVANAVGETIKLMLMCGNKVGGIVCMNSSF